MNVAIGIWALLAGGIVVPSGGDQGSASQPSAPGSYYAPAGTVPLPDNGLLGDSNGGVSAGPSPRQRPGGYGWGGYGTNSPSPRMMPRVPTDATPDLMMPMPPTAGGPLPRMPVNRAMLDTRGRMNLPGANWGKLPPAYSGQTRLPPAYSSLTAQQSSGFGAGPARIGGYVSPSMTTKPFSNYQAAPSISPWMNLYNTGTHGVDPYSLLVRPQLDQMQQNMQFNQDINGLQNEANQMVNPQQPPYLANPATGGYMSPQYIRSGQVGAPGTAPYGP